MCFSTIFPVKALGRVEESSLGNHGEAERYPGIQQSTKETKIIERMEKKWYPEIHPRTKENRIIDKDEKAQEEPNKRKPREIVTQLWLI